MKVESFSSHYRKAKPFYRLVSIGVVVFVLAMGGLFTWNEVRTARKIMTDVMIAEALMLKASFDLDKIVDLTGTPSDLTSSSYHYLRNQLIRIRDINPKFRYLYFFGRHNGQSPFFFMGTAAEDSADYSPPGQIYSEDSPTLNYVFATHKPSISPPFKDRWGTWVSALIPIIDPKSEALLAIFGMDIDAGDWKKQIIRRAMMPAVITCLTILIMGFGTGYLRRRQLIDHIIQLRQTEEALRESEERYRTILNEMSEGYYEVDLAGNYTIFNEAFHTLFGYAKNEMMGTNYSCYAAEEAEAKKLYKVFNKIYKTKVPVQNHEWDIIRKDGKRRTLQYFSTVVKDSENIPIGFRGIVRDITESKQAEKIRRENEKQLQFTNELLLKNIAEIKETKEELKNNEEKYRTLFESANDAIFLMEHERFIDCNTKTLEMFDCSMGEIIGQSPYRYSPEKQPDGRDSKLAALEKINTALNIGPQVFEWQHCRSDGSLFDAEVSFTVLSLMGRHHLLAIVQDISERKRAEEEALELQKRLNQAQKMEAIGTLAGGIAHDFNNILSGIFGYSQLAETHIHNPEKAKSHIQQILKGAQRAAELVHQVLTFSRQKETEKHPFRAYLEVKEALKLLRSSIPSTIKIIEKIDSRSLIIADPTKIHQVVMNLCTNAYHAMMDRGGILNVSLKDIEISEPKCIDGKNPVLGNYLQLEVSDTGHGMDDKTLEKAFDPYFTTKKMGEGTGLGLAIVKAIVEEHGGFLKVTSTPDKGTNFYIHFPIIEQEPSPKQIKNDMPSVFKGNESIMMVDDEEDIRLSCKEILESYGYLVHCFQNGVDAFKEFEKNPHQFDLIITDMTMPGMTGIELIEKIHDVREDIPFILCSGFSGLINHDKIMQTGVGKYLMKPVLKSDLASAIRELIDKKSYPKKSNC